MADVVGAVYERPLDLGRDEGKLTGSSQTLECLVESIMPPHSLRNGAGPVFCDDVLRRSFGTTSKLSTAS